MLRKKKIYPRFLIFVVAACFVFVCTNPFSPEKGMPKQAAAPLNSSPSNVLKNLQTAYNLHDLILFKSLLADDFKFILSPDFVSQTPTSIERFTSADIDGDSLLEVYWEKDWEIRIHKNMFEKAKTINLVFTCNTCEDSMQWIPWFDSVTKKKKGIYIQVDNVNLDITTSDNNSYRVNQSLQKFGLRKNPNDTTLWIIGEWQDESKD